MNNKKDIEWKPRISPLWYVPPDIGMKISIEGLEIHGKTKNKNRKTYVAYDKPIDVSYVNECKQQRRYKEMMRRRKKVTV